MHKCRGGIVVRAYIVNAAKCWLVDLRKPSDAPKKMEKLDPSGFFEIFIKNARKPFPYRFRVERYSGQIRKVTDPYSFAPSLTDDELYLFGKGDDRKIYERGLAYPRNRRVARDGVRRVGSDRAARERGRRLQRVGRAVCANALAGIFGRMGGAPCPMSRTGREV